MIVTDDGKAYTCGTIMDSSCRTPIELPSGFLAVAADVGSQGSCLVGLDATLRCWGPNYLGENGDGSALRTYMTKPLRPALIP